MILLIVSVEIRQTQQTTSDREVIKKEIFLQRLAEKITNQARLAKNSCEIFLVNYFCF